MHHFERWKAAIRSAADPAAVEHVVRQYVNSIMPSDMAKLPPACQELLPRAESDIPGAAVEFVREELRFMGDPDAVALLHEIAHTFVAASNRLGQIERRASGSDLA